MTRMGFLVLLAVALPVAAAPAQLVTFNRDIASIVFAHCAPCHHPGGIGPFPLLSYQDVYKHASQIGQVTQRRYMPPWPPEPGYGDFRDDRRLTDEQIQLIAAWIKQGEAEGAALYEGRSSKRVPSSAHSTWQTSALPRRACAGSASGKRRRSRQPSTRSAPDARIGASRRPRSAGGSA
jgi:cytochrome c553